MNKYISLLFFIVSILFWIFISDVALWMVLVYGYALFRLSNLILSFNRKFPIFDFFTFVYLIDNVLSLVVIYDFDGVNLMMGDSYFLDVPLMEYLPFAFLSMQAVHLGYVVNAKSNFIWDNFLVKTDRLLEPRSLFFILLLGLIGVLVTWSGVDMEKGYFNYIFHLLSSFFTCSLLGLYLIDSKKYKYLIILGLLINIFSAVNSGMFGGIMFYVIFMILFFLRKKTIVNPLKYILLKSVPFLLLCFLLISLLQNSKGDYREKAWLNNDEASVGSFNTSLLKFATLENFSSSDFYMAIFYRLNQGWLVSLTMNKVPTQVSFQYGLTISRSLFEALTPRFLNPNKEKAGGRSKILNYTNLILVGSTSMNIGYLGESYVNFGKYFSVLFFFIFGFGLATFESIILKLSLVQPYLLIFAPIIFECFLGSGIDFMLLFNSIIKSTLFVLFILKILDYKAKYV